jgi:hypothetical protein
LLDGIMAQMKFKCNFCDSGNISYFRFLGHVCDHPLPREVVGQQIESVFALGECTLTADLLACSECSLPLRPPIFRVSSALTWPERINLDVFWFDLILASCDPTLIAASLS